MAPRYLECSVLATKIEEHQPRVLQQRAKVDHGADTDKQQPREQLVGNACIKQYGYGAFLRPGLGNGAAEGQIHQNGAEAHGQQQTRLHLFGDGEVNEQRTDAPHYHHLPRQVPKVGKQTCECVQKVHFFLPPCVPVRRQEKRDFCHSTLSVTKVSSEHMTSGISAVMTLPCSSFPNEKTKTALYSLLSKALKQNGERLSRGIRKSFLNLIRSGSAAGQSREGKMTVSACIGC